MVNIVPDVRKWILYHRHDGNFDNILKSLYCLRDMSALYNEHSISVCQGGFLLPIYNMDFQFRCRVKQEIHQINVTQVIPK